MAEKKELDKWFDQLEQSYYVVTVNILKASPIS